MNFLISYARIDLCISFELILFLIKFLKNSDFNIKAKKIENIIKNLHSVYDPEIPVDIYELGLIYDLKVNSKGLVNIVMTLTSPNCPVAEILPEQVKQSAKKAEGVKDVNLKLVFEPPWTPDMMSEGAKVELNMG